MGKIFNLFILPILIAVSLWVIWPGITTDLIAEQARLVGGQQDTITLYQSASPLKAYPMPVILWLLIYVGFNFLVRLFSIKTKFQAIQTSILGFGVIWAVLGLLQWIFGAPFFTGDSSVYLRWVQEPWTLFGAHHPPGTSWLLLIGKQLGLPISATFAVIGSLELVLLRQILSKDLGPMVSWGPVVGFLLYPDFLLMRLSVWSEPGTILIILLSVLTLLSRQLNKYAKLLILCLLFLIMSELRHVAIFLLPALAIATGLVLTLRSKWQVKLIAVIFASLFLMIAWMSLNYSRTGRPLDPTTSSFECVQFIAAYHSVPFCSSAPTIPLCQSNTNMSELQQGFGLRPDFIALDRFVFRPESPLNRLQLTPEGYCDVWAKIRNELTANYKVEFAQLLFYRVASQFGMFEISERGANLRPEGIVNAISFLDRLLANSNFYLWPLWLFWLFALAKGIRSRGLYDPIVVFCLVGALGHAVGIALNNPFLALRYLGIAKYLVSIAAARLVFAKNL